MPNTQLRNDSANASQTAQPRSSQTSAGQHRFQRVGPKTRAANSPQVCFEFLPFFFVVKTGGDFFRHEPFKIIAVGDGYAAP